MTKLGAAFWIGLVLASGFTTFKVKYAVQSIHDELTRVRKQAVAEQQEIRVLTAEWAYLNQPERLAELNRNFLQLAPMTSRQMQQRVDDLPWRAPADGPDVLVAVAAPPAIAQVPASAVAAAPMVRPATATAAPPVRLATATPASLDALFARIADAR